MSTPEDFYRSGQWRAFDRVMDLLNSYDDRVVTKKDLYRDLMNMRPTSLLADLDQQLPDQVETKER